jgi:hypothetical protein
MAFTVVAFCLVAISPRLAAQMFVATGRDTLRSLTGVEILVDPLQSELERAGLTTVALRADVERRLRAGGVPVFATQKANPDPAKPFLYVHLNALEVPGRGLFAVAIQVQVRQTVQSLATRSNIVNAMTWDSHTVVVAPAAELRELSGVIGEHVDEFVGDWKAVH